MSVFRKRFHVDDQTEAEYANTKGWLVSIATAGAVFGCLGCIYLGQKLGRKIPILLFTVIYMGGVLGQTFSGGSLSGMYASRFITGIGIGATTVLPSVYITEVSHCLKTLFGMRKLMNIDRPKMHQRLTHSSIRVLPTARSRVWLLLQLWHH
jgi:MFS family permease